MGMCASTGPSPLGPCTCCGQGWGSNLGNLVRKHVRANDDDDDDDDDDEEDEDEDEEDEKINMHLTYIQHTLFIM